MHDIFSGNPDVPSACNLSERSSAAPAAKHAEPPSSIGCPWVEPSPRWTAVTPARSGTERRARTTARAGVPVVYVDPAYTSQGCSGCGHISKKNRPNRATFLCTSCGLSLPADWNAAINITMRGEEGWVVSHATERNTELAA